MSAPGYLDQRTSVTLAEGATQEIAVKLDKDPNAAVAASPPVAPEPVVSIGGATPPSDNGPKKSNTLAYVALGVGGAGLIVGGITGFLALGKKGDLNGCVDTKCPTSQKDTLDGAKSMATVSTVGFAVGFVGVGVGVVLLLTGNSNSQAGLGTSKVATRDTFHGVHVEPWVGTRSAGVTGTF